MGEESVKGANMGVILIIFAAILALGLIIFMLARNMANTGLTNVSEKLEAAEQSEYTDFDGSVVVGQRVNAALSGFKGKKVAILIATQGLVDKTALTYPKSGDPVLTDANMKAKAYGTGSGETTVGGILDSTAVDTGHENMVFAFALAPKRNADGSIDREAKERKPAPASSSGKSDDKILAFVQYNAILEPTNNVGVVTAGNHNSCIWWNDGSYVFDGSFRASGDSGKTMFDLLFANTTNTGYTEMVPGAARFHANLLKDANGVILGVVFQQIGA